jgi:hypothetical protein
VTKTVKDYPEATIRESKWMSLPKASEKVNDDGLQALLAALA